MNRFGLSFGALALSLAACASAQETVKTPEGAVLDVNPDLAYKPGELSEEQLSSSTRHLFTADFMNVFRRFPKDETDAMVKYYVDALGLKSLNPIQLTASQQMILTGIGGGQIKLSAGQPEGRSYNLGGAKAGTGVRYFRFTFPDEEALKARFVAAGFKAPEFNDYDGMRSAKAMDPGGFSLQLVIDPDAKPHGDSGLGLGINTTDLEASRAFYREFVGLDELEPRFDPQLHVMLYPFRNGETTILLFHLGGDLPNDDGSSGIQYIVSDAAMVDAKAKHRGGIGVQSPLNRLTGFDLTTIWLSDPDGVTNYFAQVGPGTPPVTEAESD